MLASRTLKPFTNFLEMQSMKNKEISRRRLLTTTGVLGVIAAQAPSKWSKPIVDAVILPTHAETSSDAASSDSVSCSMSDVAGRWQWFYDGQTESDDFDTLLADGTTESGGVIWSISGVSFTYRLEEDGGVFEVKGTLDVTCTSMSGTYNGDGESGAITGKKV